MPTLVAIAGRSRVGKGTCASLFTELAQAQGFTAFERQLSDNGKWHLARIFFPDISRVDAVAWFEDLKHKQYGVNARMYWKLDENSYDEVVVPLQKFIQHGLQEGGRDIFGEHFWTNMILPTDVWRGFPEEKAMPCWEDGFFDASQGSRPMTSRARSGLIWPSSATCVNPMRPSVSASAVASSSRFTDPTSKTATSRAVTTSPSEACRPVSSTTT
jgi:hypothetical protein